MFIQEYNRFFYCCANHDGARLPPKWLTFFLHGGFKRAKGCGYLGEGILGLTGQLKPRFVTLHTKTRLIKHDNLGKTGFQRGFKLPKPGLYRAPNCLWRVSKGFPKSFKGLPKAFQILETGILKGFQRVCEEFPKGLQRLSNPLKLGF